jgi:diguanylate cyclase (GGDEF)-like protein
MEQMLVENWAGIHYGVVLSITLALILIVYVLSDSRNPPAGLGMYTVYFMASMLGWVAITLQQSSSTPLDLDVPSVAAIISAYILFLAAGQRAGISHGRLIFGVLGLLASLSAFFVSRGGMFVVQSAAMALFFAGAGAFCVWRAWRRRNIGDAITAAAAILMVTGATVATFRYLASNDLETSQVMAVGVHSIAYALVTIGFLASVLIEYQQQLSHLATEDPLTRLLNRRGLDEALRMSLATASRHQLPVSAIMVDIDHFRRVNDSFGHEVGDHLLQRIARILQRTCRATDVVARIGGEEFLLVLPDTPLEAARAVAERIRMAVSEYPLNVDEQDIAVTVSLGVAGGQGDIDLDELSRQAGRAIYLAKRGGRNRVSSVERGPVHLSTAGSEI